jgi:hypothetical protein
MYRSIQRFFVDAAQAARYSERITGKIWSNPVTYCIQLDVQFSGFLRPSVLHPSQLSRASQKAYPMGGNFSA